MKLNELLCEYFCQHRNRRIKFSEGLNALVGPNGVGKSNILNGLYATLTNDFSRNEGVKADNICTLIPEGAKSKLTLSLTHGPDTIRVERGLNTEAARLVINDEKPILGAKQVTTELCKLLGVSPKLISDHVFVAQGDMAAFFSAAEADRAKLCERLFGIEAASKIYKLVGDEIARIEVPATGSLRDSTRERVASAQKAVADLTIARQSLDLPEEYDDEMRRRITYVTELKLLRQQQLQTETVNAQLARLMIEHDELRPQFDQLQADYKALADYVASMAEVEATARQAVAQRNRYIVNRNVLAGYDSEIAALVEKIQQEPTPRCPDNAVPVIEPEATAWWTNYRQVQDEVTYCSRCIAAAESPEPYCPTCGTVTSSLQAHYEAHKARLAELQPQLDACETAIRERAEYDKALEARKRRLAGFEGTLARIEKLRRNFEIVPEPSMSQEEAEQQLKELADIRADMVAIRTKCDALNIQRIAGQIESLRKLLASSPSDDAERVTLDQVLAAEQSRDELANTLETLREIEVKLRTAEGELRAATSALVEIDELDRQGAALRAWEGKMASIQNIFHRNGAPRIVSDNRLANLEDSINDLLSRFDADYRVTLADNLSFVATFFRGEKAGITQRASRLSGGEEVLLSLAFRVAVHSAYAGDLGLLCLDEPTSWLDKRNLGCVMTGFSRLRELCRDTGLQIIMVTHDERLIPLFDNVIDLGAGG